MDVLDGDVRVLTPKVGRVRVVFTNGDGLDGRLHAMGQSTVWLDTNSGRMSFDCRRVESIERIAAGGAVKIVKVRVTTKGGVFSGNLISREGTLVTIVTDDGLRLILESEAVVLVGEEERRVGIRRRDE